MQVKWRPSLRSVLLLINLVIVLLPLGGIAWLRLYESALLRQTESELLAQGTVVAAAFKGEMLPASGAAAPQADTGFPAEWQARPARLDLSVDPIYPRPPDAQPTALQASPEAAEAGRRFNAVLREVRLHTLAGIRIVDAQGIVIASTAGDIGGLLTQEEVVQALRGETVSRLRERQYEAAPSALSRTAGIRVFVALPITQDQRVLGAVLLARTPASFWDTIQGKRAPLIYAALIMLAIVLILSWLTTRTLANPIAELRAQAQRAASGDSQAVQPLRHAGTREVAELSESLIAMSASLQERADYIRRFAAQVSHEFKTPLTGIRGAVELLREHADELTPEERARFQNIIAAEAERLDRLVRRLLELARADVAQPGEASCDPLRVLQSCIVRARELGLSVDSHLPEAHLLTRISAEDLETVFSNLLDNLRQHAPGSAARVEAVPEQATLRVIVSDDGPGISDANAGQVFEPFFTTARNTGNTGLGLSIVRALLSAHRGEIRLHRTGQGTRVEVTLPLA